MKTENLETLLARLVETDDDASTPKRTAIGEVTHRAFDSSIRSIDEKARTIEFVASTEATDRYGDIIRVAGWKFDAYMRNPVFLFGHRSGEPPIGRTVELRKESNPPALVQKVQFADKETYPFADTIFQLYKKGFMRAVSVGFRPLEEPTAMFDETSGRMTGYEFTNQELLELSAVPIPANPEALARGFISDDEAAKIFRDAEAPVDEHDLETLRESLYGLLMSVARQLADVDERLAKNSEPQKPTGDDAVNQLLFAIVE